MPNRNPQNCCVRFQPSGLKTEVPRGATLLEAAQRAGVYLTSLCGGDGTCGKCTVVVSEGDVDAPPAAPPAEARTGRTVLACQARVRGDVTVSVPCGHALDTARILVGIDTHRGPHPAADHAFPFDPPAPDVADAAACHYAVAADIGTTTLAAHLVDLAAAETVDAEAAYNSQMQFGDDYVRRIMHAEVHGGFGEMQRLVVQDLNQLIASLVGRQGLEAGQVTSIVAAGNTAMIHFLFGRDAGWIRRGLDRPQDLRFPPCPASEVGLHVHPRGTLRVLPAVGAYVGADIVAGVLATRLYESPGLALFIDIGTNGEVVLGSREWMVCASSSAGPAFEGAGIRHGMRAAPGAIERLTVTADGGLRYHTIGDVPPRGLCGTGLLDTLAGLLEIGVIDRSGRLARTADPRLAEGPDGLEFALVPATDGRGPIVITQADISNLVRSKAGVYAAIQVLLESSGTTAGQLTDVYVAGGFGNSLDVRKAIAIGMLPDVAPERVHFVGNTSVAGAKMAAMSRQALAKADEIAARMTYFDLMNHPHYMDAFVQANFLPHTDLARFPSVRRRTAAAARAEGPTA